MFSPAAFRCHPSPPPPPRDDCRRLPLAIRNVPESSLGRESDVARMTRGGPAIGVASTRAFTTRLVSLRLIRLALATPVTVE
jgi:glucosamine 6-phosphate synthetase-like amidotransferase/phosphosugar isomerase protein